MSDKIQNTVENWEDGTLGASAEHAVRVDASEVDAINKATGLNMRAISIRMPSDLLRVLKEIAKYHGIGYQPMIRDLLDRWAVGEIKAILHARLDETNKRETEQKASTPLAGDLRRVG